MLKYFIFLIASSLALCLAGPLTPLEPAPNDKFTEGGSLSISWTADTTGAWKVTNIELMTGDNFEMRHLTTLATVDGTDATNISLSVPCPFVTPHSAIYFLQFSAVGQTMWTGRFAIVGSDGAVTPPANSTQPDGSDIPWGIGMLVSPSFPGTPPPSTAPTGQIDASGSSSSTSESSSSAPPALSPNTTEGLGASTSSSSTSSSSPAGSSPSTVMGLLPGEMTTSASSSPSQPSSEPDPTPSTTSSNQTNQNNALTIIHSYSTLASIPMLLTSLVLSGNLF